LVSATSDFPYFNSHSDNVSLWEVTSGMFLKKLWETTYQARSNGIVRFSPNGNIVAFTEFYSTENLYHVSLVNSDTGEYAGAVHPSGERWSEINNIAFSADNKIIAVVASLKEDHFERTEKVFWDTVSHERLNFKDSWGTNSNTTNDKFSTNGKILVPTLVGSRVVFCDSKTGDLLKIPENINEAYSPDGKLMATSKGRNRNIEIWDAIAQTKLQTLQGGGSSVVFSPNGKMIASASGHTIKLFNAKLKSLLQTLDEQENEITKIKFSNDGKMFFSIYESNRFNLQRNSGMMIVRDLNSYSLLQNLDLGNFNGAKFSPDGKTIATYAELDEIKLYDVVSGTLLKKLGEYWIRGIKFSPDGKLIATFYTHNTIKLWDIDSGARLQTLECFNEDIDYDIQRPRPSKVNSVTFSPDSKLIITVSEGHAQLWNILSGTLLKTFEELSDDRAHIPFSPDGKIIALASNNNINLRDAFLDNILIRTLSGHTKMVRKTKFSPGGNMIGSYSCDGMAKLWDVASGSVLHTMNGYGKIIFSPNCTLLEFQTAQKIQLWDIAYKALVGTICDNFIFSPNNKNIASVSSDKTIKLWCQKKDKWLLKRIVSATESPLIANDMLLQNSILSTLNQKVFEQKGAKASENIVDDEETKNDVEDFAVSRQIAQKMSKDLLKEKLVEKLKEMALKLVPVNQNSPILQLPLQLEERRMQELQNVEPMKMSIKHKPIVNPPAFSKKTCGSTCCKIFAITHIRYHHPLLNHPSLLQTIAENLKTRPSKILDASIYLSVLFGDEDFRYIVNTDVLLLQEMLQEAIVDL